MLGKPLTELSAKPGFEQKKSFRRVGIKSNIMKHRGNGGWTKDLGLNGIWT